MLSLNFVWLSHWGHHAVLHCTSPRFSHEHCSIHGVSYTLTVEVVWLSCSGVAESNLLGNFHSILESFQWHLSSVQIYGNGYWALSSKADHLRLNWMMFESSIWVLWTYSATYHISGKTDCAETEIQIMTMVWEKKGRQPSPTPFSKLEMDLGETLGLCTLGRRALSSMMCSLWYESLIPRPD